MLVPYVVDYFRRKGYIVFTEQYVGYGKVDAIAITLNKDEIRRRMVYGVPHLPIRALLRIMRILDRYDKINIKDLAKYLSYSEGYVRRIVSYVNPLYLRNEEASLGRLAIIFLLLRKLLP